MRGRLPEGMSTVSGWEAPSRRVASACDVTLDLECITAVIGGGVETKRPDVIDGVRVPALRGALRAFWRMFQDETEPSALFQKEIEIWGGVGEGPKDCVRSSVRVFAEVLNKGRLVAAGWHEPNARGRLKALPRWSSPPTLGYALFPLQRNEKERSAAEARGELPLATESVRTGLEFRLRLAIENEANVEPVLQALWAWVHLAGVGARTTRGFGALAVKKAEGLPKAWQTRFQLPSAAEVRGLLSSLLFDKVTPMLPERSAGWTRLAGARLFLGNEESSAERGHAAAVDPLRKFRQGIGLGRAQGRDRREGQSHWPEAHLLRLLAEESGVSGDWEHRPPRDRTTLFKKDGEWAVPRAAFGLPLIVQFKDNNDKRANATIECSRMTSPVRLRPLKCLGDRYVPLALLLRTRPPASLHIEPDGSGRKAASAVARVDPGHNAAEGPIRDFLSRADGDAVDAFALCLGEGFGFKELARGGK